MGNFECVAQRQQLKCYPGCKNQHKLCLSICPGTGALPGSRIPPQLTAQAGQSGISLGVPGNPGNPGEWMNPPRLLPWSLCPGLEIPAVIIWCSLCLIHLAVEIQGTDLCPPPFSQGQLGTCLCREQEELVKIYLKHQGHLSTGRDCCQHLPAHCCVQSHRDPGNEEPNPNICHCLE